MRTPEEYVNEIKAKSDAEWLQNKYTLPAPTFCITYNQKYIRITRTVFGQTSVHCFLDYDGNIYKAASWKTPAKGIRGNINNEKKPLRGGDYYWIR